MKTHMELGEAQELLVAYGQNHTAIGKRCGDGRSPTKMQTRTEIHLTRLLLAGLIGLPPKSIADEQVEHVIKETS